MKVSKHKCNVQLFLYLHLFGLILQIPKQQYMAGNQFIIKSNTHISYEKSNILKAAKQANKVSYQPCLQTNFSLLFPSFSNS